MKRALFQEKSTQVEKKAKLTKDWLSRVNKYKSSAVQELSSIYSTLTNETIVEKPIVSDDLYWVKTAQPILSTDNHELIYSLSTGVIKYGPEEKEYPVSDTSLWPWKIRETKANLIPKDILLMIIFRYVKTLGDLFQMRLVCKKWKEWIDNSAELWARVGNTYPIRYFGLPTLSIRDFYLSLPHCKSKGRNATAYKKFVMDLSIHDQVKFFASMYAPLTVQQYYTSLCTARIDSALENTRNPKKKVEKYWIIEFQEIIPPLHVFTQYKTSTFYVAWSTSHLSSKQGLSARYLWGIFRDLVINSRKTKGCISHWAIKYPKRE